VPSESYFGVLALRVPYTCQEIAETADLAFLAFLRTNNFLVFSGTFSFDPLLQHRNKFNILLEISVFSVRWLATLIMIR